MITCSQPPSFDLCPVYPQVRMQAHPSSTTVRSERMWNGGTCMYLEGVVHQEAPGRVVQLFQREEHSKAPVRCFCTEGVGCICRAQDHPVTYKTHYMEAHYMHGRRRKHTTWDPITCMGDIQKHTARERITCMGAHYMHGGALLLNCEPFFLEGKAFLQSLP